MTKILLDWKNDPAPLEVVQELHKAGHEAFLAGGCVRDFLLQHTPKDHDIATSATPEEVEKIFKRTIPVQPELGVTMVLWGESRLEVTTFRTEGTYIDGRRPSRIGPANAKLDVQRRDFTINGMLLDPETGEIHDHVGGIEDLNAGVLRCIRDPRERFTEDHLRILRAVRFAVRFDLRIDPATWDAMVGLSDKISVLSGERIHEELTKMEAQGSFDKSVELLFLSGALRAINGSLHEKLADGGSRQRLLEMLRANAQGAPGTWITLLGLPLCDWWETPTWFGNIGRLHPAHKDILERLRCSRAQTEAAIFAWTRWPLCWEQPAPVPSSQAALVRDRSWPTLEHALTRFQIAFSQSFSPVDHLAALAAKIPKSLPALGEAFHAAGIPKGPRLGDAIREADRLNLDEGAALDGTLVSRVAKTILDAS